MRSMWLWSPYSVSNHMLRMLRPSNGVKVAPKYLRGVARSMVVLREGLSDVAARVLQFIVKHSRSVVDREHRVCRRTF